MSFRWVNYYHLACDLLKQAVQDPALRGKPEAEARLRSAVSRFYYAAYGEVSDFVRKNGYLLSGAPSDHKNVPEYLRKIGIEEGLVELEKAAERLTTLKEKRKQADYETDCFSRLRTNPERMAESAKRLANKVLSAIGLNVTSC